jgi:hypothetical protein
LISRRALKSQTLMMTGLGCPKNKRSLLRIASQINQSKKKRNQRQSLRPRRLSN